MRAVFFKVEWGVWEESIEAWTSIYFLTLFYVLMYAL